MSLKNTTTNQVIDALTEGKLIALQNAELAPFVAIRVKQAIKTAIMVTHGDKQFFIDKDNKAMCLEFISNLNDEANRINKLQEDCMRAVNDFKKQVNQ